MIKDNKEALTLALALAITAPNDKKAEKCVKIADSLAKNMKRKDVELAMKDAEIALEEFEPGQERIRHTHIIINSNNGGSFNEEEGNRPGVDGEELNFTFDSEDGFDLAWLRIGNIKIETTEDILEYLESFDKKNLTIHAHFKKDKDYSPEITEEETDPDRGG